MFQDERASLMELRGPFDSFVEKAVRASTTCLISTDRNRYSVNARAAGRMVLVRSHAERIVVLLGDEMVANHPRQFRRLQAPRYHSSHCRRNKELSRPHSWEKSRRSCRP